MISTRLNRYDRAAARAARVQVPITNLSSGDLYNPPRCGVFAHIFYPELAPDLLGMLINIPADFDIFISTTSADRARRIESHIPDHLQARTQVQIFENRGRDIYPKLFGFADAHNDLDLCLHVHSKKSLHSGSLSTWRERSFDALLGSSDHVRDIFSAFQNDPKLGLICPDIPSDISPGMNWMRNWQIAIRLNRSLGYKLPAPGKPFVFPAGSMFWARPSVLRPIMDLALAQADFPIEEGQQDGTPAHAIERLLGIALREQGKKMYFVAPPRMTDPDQPPEPTIGGPGRNRA